MPDSPPTFADARRERKRVLLVFRVESAWTSRCGLNPEMLARMLDENQGGNVVKYILYK